MVLRRSPHQRGLAIPVVSRVHFRAAVEKQLKGFGGTRSRGGHQDGFALGKNRVGIGSGVEQIAHHGGVAVNGSQVQRRHSVAVGAFCIGARAEKQAGHFRIVRLDGPMQRGGSIGSGNVHEALPAGAVAARARESDFFTAARSALSAACTGAADNETRVTSAKPRAEFDHAVNRNERCFFNVTRPRSIYLQSRSKRPVLSPMLSIGLPNMDATPSQTLAIGVHSGAMMKRLPLTRPPAPPITRER